MIFSGILECIMLLYICRLLIHIYCNFRPNKWYVALDVKFERDNPDGGTKRTTAYMRSTPAIMINQFETQQQLEDAVIRLDTLIDTFTNVGSGWTINQLGNVTLHIGDYDVIGGSNYIASPKWLELKKATVNIKNKDNLCFAYCMLAASHPQKNRCSTCQSLQYVPYLMS